MLSNSLRAISPIDGRYQSKTDELRNYFSEYGLIKYRVRVEIEYFIALCEIPLNQLKDFDQEYFGSLRIIYQNFRDEDANRIKEIEKATNHDVKAVEYLIKEHFNELGLSKYSEFIHFGLTSQDINNTAIPLSLKEAHENIIAPAYYNLLNQIKAKANEWADIAMLAKTHGQPASPTRVGKEIAVFAERLEKQLDLLAQIPFSAKFGGATGNFNAHHVAYPDVNWVDFSNRFVNNILGLSRSQVTTQIEHYDMLAAYFDNIKRINTILIDFSRDVWQYISMHYFKQKIMAGEVGSSAMPHKVNPIDFENAEGNLGVANALLEHLSSKLPVSRLQRDLTDSTVLRNIGVPLAHSLISIKSLEKGIGKLEINENAIHADLEANWAVVAEAIQTILRRDGFPKPYEKLKDLTRNNERVSENTIKQFIDSLDISEKVKYELKQISPFNYTGIKDV